MTMSRQQDVNWRTTNKRALLGLLPARLLARGRTWAELIRVVFIEHRKAQAASQIYERLRHRSAEDLAKAGIRREELANEIRTRLYSGSKRS